MSNYTTQQKHTDLQFLDHVEGLMHDGQTIMSMSSGQMVECLCYREIQALDDYVATYERVDMSVDEAFSKERQQFYHNVVGALNIIHRREERNRYIYR